MLPIESAFLFTVVVWFWMVVGTVRYLQWCDNGC